MRSMDYPQVCMGKIMQRNSVMLMDNANNVDGASQFARNVEVLPIVIFSWLYIALNPQLSPF